MENNDTFKFSPDGQYLAIEHLQYETNWLEFLKAWLPGFLRPARSDRGSVEIRVEDAGPGRTLTHLTWPIRDINEQSFHLLDEGKTLAVRYWLSQRESKKDRIYITELWDIPAPPNYTSAVMSVALLTLILGGWYDRIAKKQVSSSPTFSIA